MTFQDVFKSSFLKNVDSVSLADMTLALFLALCLGLFILFVYRKTFHGVMYSTSFAVTLVALTMITTVVILAVTSNVVLSLGMVGALSIVRFRTAVKDPLDIAFLFWALVVGIVLAAGMIPLAVVGSLVIGVTVLVLANRRSWAQPYILVLECDGQDSENAARELACRYVRRMDIKSKTARAGKVELTLQVLLKEENTDFVGDLAALPGVSDAVLVSFNGDYNG